LKVQDYTHFLKELLMESFSMLSKLIIKNNVGLSNYQPLGLNLAFLN